jgi:hypothetical protein
MRQRALIYLQGLPSEPATYVGEREIEPGPVLNGIVRFGHNGRIESVRVQRLEPPGWNANSDVIPLVYVTPVWQGPVSTRKSPPKRG